MRTRFCLNCGEPYESEAETELHLPFCSKAWHRMSDEERCRNELTLEACCDRLHGAR